jgi:hypothetical protein
VLNRTKIPATRRITFAVWSLLIIGFLWRLLAIAFTSQTSVINMPLPDDAFYYFSLARNIASGKGIVIAGSDIPTTGFQPLWGFILTALYLIFGSLSSSQLIVLAQFIGAVAGIISGWLLYRLTLRVSGNSSTALLVLGTFCLSPQVIRHNLNGMETSLTILAVIVVIILFVTFWDRSTTPGQAFLSGLSCGLAILTRMDVSLLIAIALVLYAVRGFNKKIWRSWVEAIRSLLIFGAGCLLPLVPWLWLGVSLGKGLIPESGGSIRVLGLVINHLKPLSPLESILSAPLVYIPFYAQNAIDFTFAWIRQVPVLLPVSIPLYTLFGIGLVSKMMCVIAALVIVLVIYAAYRDSNYVLLGMSGLWLFTATGMALAYSIFITGQWFYHRYSAWMAIVANMLIIMAGIRYVIPKRHELKTVIAGGLVIAAAFGALVWGGSYRWLIAGKSAVPDDGWYRASQYVSEELPSQAKVGVFSAGLIGYYAPQPVIPLDGKVSREARTAILTRSMFDYLCRQNIAYIVDWPKQVRNLLIFRTKNWDDENLSEIHRILSPGFKDIVVYEVSRDACGKYQSGVRGSLSAVAHLH